MERRVNQCRSNSHYATDSAVLNWFRRRSSAVLKFFISNRNFIIKMSEILGLTVNPERTSNLIRVYMRDWVGDWRMAVNQNMIRNWNFFLIICTDHSYFFGDFSTYKFKLSCFANNLYFGHNWTSVSFRVSFQSEISIQVHMIPSWHFIPDCMSVLSGMKIGMNPTRMSYNSIRIHANKYNLIPYGYGQNKNRPRMTL